MAHWTHERVLLNVCMYVSARVCGGTCCIFTCFARINCTSDCVCVRRNSTYSTACKQPSIRTNITMKKKNTYIHIHTLDYITLHCTTLHHTTLHYIHTYLHYITLHDMTWHDKTRHDMTYLHTQIQNTKIHKETKLHTYMHTYMQTYGHTDIHAYTYIT